MIIKNSDVASLKTIRLFVTIGKNCELCIEREESCSAVWYNTPDSWSRVTA